MKQTTNGTNEYTTNGTNKHTTNITNEHTPERASQQALFTCQTHTQAAHTQDISTNYSHARNCYAGKSKNCSHARQNCSHARHLICTNCSVHMLDTVLAVHMLDVGRYKLSKLLPQGKLGPLWSHCCPYTCTIIQETRHCTCLWHMANVVACTVCPEGRQWIQRWPPGVIAFP